jgi:hypothetical protein
MRFLGVKESLLIFLRATRLSWFALRQLSGVGKNKKAAFEESGL